MFIILIACISGLKMKVRIVFNKENEAIIQNILENFLTFREMTGIEKNYIKDENVIIRVDYIYYPEHDIKYGMLSRLEHYSYYYITKANRKDEING